MEIRIIKVDSKNKLIIGGIIGLSSVVIITVFTTLSILLFPGYNLLKNMVSNLGLTIRPGRIFFNIGMGISAILAFGFFYYFRYVFIDKRINKTIKSITFLFGYLACICDFITGIYPSGDQLTGGKLHLYTAFLSWFLFLIFLSLLIYMITRQANYPRLGLILNEISMVSIILTIATWRPVTEWSMYFILVVWMIFNSILMIKIGLKERIAKKELIIDEIGIVKLETNKTVIS